MKALKEKSSGLQGQVVRVVRVVRVVSEGLTIGEIAETTSEVARLKIGGRSRTIRSSRR